LLREGDLLVLLSNQAVCGRKLLLFSTWDALHSLLRQRDLLDLG